ncbi:putative zinc knuckle transcription factor [Phyllosticta citricarpa]
MSWDPVPAGDGQWQPDAGGDDGNWGGQGDSGFEGGAGDVGGGAGGAEDVECHNCKQMGHYSRDCPEEKQFTGECYNCGEVGHNKADCPNPKVFRGTCRHCNEEGHPASQCPTKPPVLCRNCQQEGHNAADCENPRAADILYKEVPEMSDDDAWNMLVEADQEHNLDDFRIAIKAYGKALLANGQPIDLVDIDKQMREDGMNVHIVAVDKKEKAGDVFTIVDFAGKTGCTYALSFNYSYKPKRKNVMEAWPKTPEENRERLSDAGFVVDRFVMKCTQCGEIGHSRKFCKQEREEIDRPEVKCLVCQETGHRARDCKQERVDPHLCKNCNKRGHNSRDCPEPPNMDNVECRKCQQKGHFSKECPNVAPKTCNNCGEAGHMSKECEKPKAKLMCKNCEEYGHGAKKCPKPVVEKDKGGFDMGGGDSGFDAGGGGSGFDAAGGAAAGGGWDTAAAGDDGGKW